MQLRERRERPTLEDRRRLPVRHQESQAVDRAGPRGRKTQNNRWTTTLTSTLTDQQREECLSNCLSKGLGCERERNLPRAAFDRPDLRTDLSRDTRLFSRLPLSNCMRHDSCLPHYQGMYLAGANKKIQTPSKAGSWAVFGHGNSGPFLPVLTLGRKIKTVIELKSDQGG